MCFYGCLVFDTWCISLVILGLWVWFTVSCQVLFCTWLVGAVDSIVCGRLPIVWYLFVGFVASCGLGCIVVIVVLCG